MGSLAVGSMGTASTAEVTRSMQRQLRHGVCEAAQPWLREDRADGAWLGGVRLGSNGADALRCSGEVSLCQERRGTAAEARGVLQC
jgi:hypothetical protein